MANFAQLDNNNLVINVVVVDDSQITINGQENENLGITFLQNLFGVDTIWKQTSYNASMRKNFASIGFTYDLDIDAFLWPQPYPSWSLNKTTGQWEAPIPFPNDRKDYNWNEVDKTWDIIVNNATPVHSAT